MKRLGKRALVGILTSVMALGQISTVYGGWQGDSGSWFWVKEDGARLSNGWQTDLDGNRYYFGDNGAMLTGWQLINGSWYYLNNVVSDGTPNLTGKPFGAALTGWVWIDGKSYLFKPDAGDDYGKMYTDIQTPDGFLVNKDGQWIDEAGNVQINLAKGITSSGEIVEKAVDTKTKTRSSGSGGGGSSSGGGGSSSGGGGGSSGGGGGSSEGGSGSEGGNGSEGGSGSEEENNPQRQQELQEVIDNFVSEYIEDGMSDYTKEMIIIKYMCDRIHYDEYMESSNAYTALVKGMAHCDGYSEAFNKLAKASGLEAKMVDSETLDHAWNYVKLDGEWYQVDVTYKDYEGEQKGQYDYAIYGVNFINYNWKRSEDMEPYIPSQAYQYGYETTLKYLETGVLDTSVPEPYDKEKEDLYFRSWMDRTIKYKDKGKLLDLSQYNNEDELMAAVGNLFEERIKGQNGALDFAVDTWDADFDRDAFGIKVAAYLAERYPEYVQQAQYVPEKGKLGSLTYALNKKDSFHKILISMKYKELVIPQHLTAIIQIKDTDGNLVTEVTSLGLKPGQCFKKTIYNVNLKDISEWNVDWVEVLDDTTLEVTLPTDESQLSEKQVTIIGTLNGAENGIALQKASPSNAS